MCLNSPLVPKKKTSAGRFAASFIVSGKKIDMLRTPRTMAHFWHHTHNFKIRVYFLQTQRNGILLPKLFCPTERKKCSSEKLLKFETEG